MRTTMLTFTRRPGLALTAISLLTLSGCGNGDDTRRGPVDSQPPAADPQPPAITPPPQTNPVQPPDHSAPRTPVAGTRVRLIKPEGFTQAERFPGFQQAETNSSIMVTELPAPYAEVTVGFTPEKMKSRGMTLLSKQAIKIDGRQGFLLHLKQMVRSVTFEKWIVTFGDDTETVLLTATFPVERADELGKRLQQAVLSATWDKGKVVDPFADLNFTLDTPASLKFAKRVGNTLLYTRDGHIPAKSPKDPLFVAGSAFGNIGPVDKKQFVERRIAQTASVKQLRIETTKEIGIAGLSGYETVATAKETETSVPLVVYQVILFEGQSYFLMQGLVGAGSRADFLDDFKKMARTFRKK